MASAILMLTNPGRYGVIDSVGLPENGQGGATIALATHRTITSS